MDLLCASTWSSQQCRLIIRICDGKLRHYLGHLLWPVALISKMTKLTTITAIDLRLVQLVAVLFLVDVAAGAFTT